MIISSPIKQLFLLLLCMCPAVVAVDVPFGNQEKNVFGTLASDSSFDAPTLDLPEHPPLSNTGKSYLTYNKYGFDIINELTPQDSWLIESLLKFVSTAKRPVLDIGGGYGGLTCLLARESATIIYNDIEKMHLLFGRKRLTKSQRHHVYLNTKAFPEEMDYPPNSLDAVVLYRVLHFMNPEQIEAGLEKAYQWLAPGGKIFIAVLAPQHADYRDKVLYQYEKLWGQGEGWPGKELITEEILPSQAYALPPRLHVMDERPLRKALEKYHFQIESADFISLKKFGDASSRDGKESFGIIAVKR